MKLWRFVRGQFFGRAALWFVLFALPWPGVAEWYTGVGASVLNVALGKSGPPVAVEFLPAEPGSGSWDVRTRVTRTDSGRSIMTALDERRTGYLPCAVFLALVLASTYRARKKALLAASGLFVLELLSLLPVLAFLSGRLPIVAYELGTAARVVVDVLYRSLVAPLGMAYALPALLFLLLSAAVPREAPVVPEKRAHAASTRRGRKAPAAKRQRTGVTTR
ncbi:MAG TPA: hypothetical protein VMI54_30545 [Polyangiaceae bacterium]|nr:hypothetical protein [Polyangiaceae bacterium]